MILLDGKATAETILQEIKQEVDSFRQQGLREPGLAVIMAGNNPASASYVRNKIRSCEKVGFHSQHIHVGEDITQEAILDLVHDLNQDDRIDGFIVQLPLPNQINVDQVIAAIDPSKDVDGFHPMNMGNVSLGREAFISATPNGILELIKRYEIETSGKHVVVVGRSNIVGRPMSILLSRSGYPGNATVTLTHSRTQDLKAITLQADILIAAVGRPNMITADMVKPGAVIIDVGINRVEDSSRKRGYRLVGDVDFEGISHKASYATPVPGGVGPMTVTSLMMNTLKSYKKRVQ
ncbi:MAG: bifunctional methylenetetrahydrofolate dehydrogenase/methenyltetrahydrofolate cyclohydrolase FolD [Saprospiraceae bacterium]|nr:bifunctional methylenetetrahydrofolate dehydrogenase/methenyltetrahydrofolate cyclohydrolase FolD [Saprospiraceae bacterium]